MSGTGNLTAKGDGTVAISGNGWINVTGSSVEISITGTGIDASMAGSGTASLDGTGTLDTSRTDGSHFRERKSQ